MLSCNLKVGVFRFALVPAQELVVPALNKGNMLRGGFGHAFRRLCCVPQCTDTRACPLATTCPYKAVFEPSPPPGAERLSKNQDVPRPFVFRAPQTQQTRFAPGQPFEFSLVLIGRALDFLPYFVLSFRELAAGGLGLNRAKCTLQRVDHILPPANGVAPEPATPSANRASEPAHVAPFDVAPPFRAARSACDVAPPSRAAHSCAHVAPRFSAADSAHHDVAPRFSAGGPAVALAPPPRPTQSAQPIYSAEDQVFRPAASLTADDWIHARLRQLGASNGHLECQHPDRPAPPPPRCHPERSEGSAGVAFEPNAATEIHRITIHFLTPTLLRADGEIIRRPEFHHVIKRLRDRINALCTFFGDGPLDVDFRALGQRAEKVRTLSAQIQWVDRTRFSSRTHQRHDLSGFVGQAEYEGELADFFSWLALAELISLGKHAVWGNGSVAFST